MKKIKFIALLVALLSLQSGYTHIRDTMTLAHFDQIIATGIIEVTLQQGNEEKLVLVTNDFDRDDVKVMVTEGVLKIFVVKSLIKDAKIEVFVTYKQLRRIKANTGASVSSENIIEIDKLDLKANSGARIELELQVNDLHARLAEGAQIQLSGTTESQDITASSGANFYGFELTSDYTYVNANTGGRAEVIANKSIEATANTGGRIEYKGDPETIKIKDYLGGEIENL